MTKYINADKLIKSLNNYQDGAEAALNPIDGDADYYKGKIDACKDIQEFITSLQQKQEEYVIDGRVFGATDIEQLYKGKVYIVSNLVQDREFGIEPREHVKMLLIKD